MSKKSTEGLVDVGTFPILIDPDKSWIRGHYHCKKCGGEIKCWKGFPWQVDVGVSRIGGCEKDKLMMVEYEKSDPKWIQL